MVSGMECGNSVVAGECRKGSENSERTLRRRLAPVPARERAGVEGIERSVMASSSSRVRFSQPFCTLTMAYESLVLRAYHRSVSKLEDEIVSFVCRIVSMSKC